MFGKKKKKEKKKLFSKLLDKKEKPEEIPVIYLRNSGKAEVRYVTPERNLIDIDGKKIHLKPGSEWEIKEGMKSKKVLIIPEWGMYPLGTFDYLKELKSDAATFQQDVIRAIQHAQTVREEELLRRKGLQLSPGTIIAIAIIAIVIIYFVATAAG